MSDKTSTTRQNIRTHHLINTIKFDKNYFIFESNHIKLKNVIVFDNLVLDCLHIPYCSDSCIMISLRRNYNYVVHNIVDFSKSTRIRFWTVDYIYILDRLNNCIMITIRRNDNSYVHNIIDFSKLIRIRFCTIDYLYILDHLNNCVLIIVRSNDNSNVHYMIDFLNLL